MHLIVLIIMSLIMTLREFLSREILKAVICVGMAMLSNPAVAQVSSADISKGAYLARIGDCAACHTAGPQSPPFVGGLPLNSPFGKIYSREFK